MSNIQLCDSNRLKCDALKEIGIIVSNYIFNERMKYVIKIIGMPDADKCMETTFNSINDIILAFRDRLCCRGFKVA